MKKIVLALSSVLLSTFTHLNAQCNVTVNASKTKICSNDKVTLTTISSGIQILPDFSESNKIFNVSDLKLDPLFILGIQQGAGQNMGYLFPQKSDTLKLLLNGYKLKNTVIASGSLEVVVETDLKQDAKIVFELPYFKKNGKSIKDSILIDGKTAGTTGIKSYIKTFDLQNAIIDFSLGDPSKSNLINYAIKASLKISTTTFTGTETGNLKINLKNVNFLENTTFKWFKDGNELANKNTPSIDVNETGKYLVETTSNCGISKDSVNIQVVQNPEIKLNHKDTTIVIGSELNIKATGAATYEWNDKTTNDNITIKDAGTYSVNGKNDIGCTSSASIKVEVREKGVGLTNLNGLKVAVSPNPSSDVLHVTVDDFKNKAISIVDLKGNYVFSQDLMSANTAVSVNSFAKGIYILNIVDGLNSIVNSQRIVIE